MRTRRPTDDEPQTRLPFPGWLAEPRPWFALDGAGALVSALLLGAVLPWFADALGTTREALRTLAVLPMLYAAFDLVCVVRGVTAGLPLLAIACANIAYPVIGALVLRRDGVALTGLGLAWFATEAGIVLALAALEVTVAVRARPTAPERP